ncbi:MAG: amidohydrolase family protein, partial [Firmicutes bacterium]|nr:amidohydrolase family protein [Bacillota bacterium]
CRHAIEHLEVVHDDDFERIKELGIFPSVQPEHLALTDKFEDNPYPTVLGPERGYSCFPYRRLYAAAGILGFGSDCPVVDNNPFLEIFRAVTRVHNDFQPEGGWMPEEKLTLSEALRCYTYGSAYGVMREDEIGSLSAGKFADLVVLDKDIFMIPEEELLERKVIMTIMDGNIIYDVTE